MRQYLLLILIVFSSLNFGNTVKVVQLSTLDEKHYLPNSADYFDTYTQAQIGATSEGTNKYGISLWFKHTYPYTDNSTQVLIHLTMLDTPNPSDYTTVPDSIRHLSRMVYCTIRLASGDTFYLHCSFSTFTLDVNVLINDEQIINTNGIWTFLYIGLDHISGQYRAYLLKQSSGLQTISSFTNTRSIIPTAGMRGNEQLDERTKLYIGGSVNNLGFNFDGAIRHPTFYIDYLPADANAAQSLIHGELTSFYEFNLNVRQSSYIFDLVQKQNRISFGDDPTSANYPTFLLSSGSYGIQFSASDFSTLHLDFELDKSTFFAFYLRIDADPAISQNILTFTRADGTSTLLALIVNNGRTLSLSVPGTSFTTSALTLAAWNHVVLLFSAKNPFDSVIASLVVNGVFQITSLQSTSNLNGQYDTTRQVLIGKSTQTNGFSIANLKIGQGSYVLETSSNPFIAQCTVSVGLENARCLVCSTGYKLDNTLNTCIIDIEPCPDGYFLFDHSSNKKECLPCHESCLTCFGLTDQQCITCKESTPILFTYDTSKKICLSACPYGTVKTSNNTCICDSQCANCTIANLDTLVVTCIDCATSTMYKQGHTCVDSFFCAYGTYGYPTSEACQSTCTLPYPKYDPQSRLCVDTCPATTIEVSNVCLETCPSGQYNNAGTCTACTNGCAKCVSATECLECNSAALYLHEVTGACLTPCATGFLLDGGICRVCQKKGATPCTSCPATYILHEGTCILSCPSGYEYNAVSFACEIKPNPEVSIEEDTGATFSIGRRKDLVLHGKYEFIGNISSVLWSLDSSNNTSAGSLIFQNVLRDRLVLVVPSQNLLADTQYVFKLLVTTSTSTSDFELITVATSKALTEGTFTVTPSSGVTGQTNFRIQISGWADPNLGTLKFDIVYFTKRQQIFRSNTVEWKEDLNAIALEKADQTELSYQFPPQNTGPQQVTIQLTAYTDKEQIKRTATVTLTSYNDSTINIQSNVWWMKFQTGLDLDEYLERTNYLSYLYEANQLSLLLKVHKEDIIKQNQLLNHQEFGCEDEVQCNGRGQCAKNFYDQQRYSCECYFGSYGEYCSWEEREVQILNNVTYNVLTGTRSYVVSAGNFSVSVYKLVKILRNLVSINDGLSKKSFSVVRANLVKIYELMKVHTLQSSDIYQEIFYVLSQLIYQSNYRPSLRPDEIIKWGIIFRNIFLDFLKLLRENHLQLHRDFIYRDNYLAVLLTKTHLTYLQGGNFNVNSYVSLPLDKSVIQIPESALPEKDVFVVQLIQYNINPVYPDDYIMTSQVDIQFFNEQYQNLVITGLSASNSIWLNFMKKGSYPPLREDISTYYQCAYLNKVDEETFEWVADDTCKFTFENEYFIRCACSSLKQFTVKRGLVEYIEGIPQKSEISFFSQKALRSKKTQVQEISYEYNPWIQISQREYLPLQMPSSRLRYTWSQPCLIIMAIILFFYLILTLLYQFYFSKHSLPYHDYDRNKLLLSYHPFFTIFLLGDSEYSNNYQMRITKLITVVIGHAGFVALAFRQFPLFDASIKMSPLIIISVFFSILANPSFNYLAEGIYYFVKKHMIHDKRKTWVYLVVYFIAIAGLILMGVYSNGYTSIREHRGYVAAYFIALIVDIAFFDTLITIYAFLMLDTPFLGFLAFRGFYIQIDPEQLYKKVLDQSQQKKNSELDKVDDAFSDEMLDLDVGSSEKRKRSKDKAKDNAKDNLSAHSGNSRDKLNRVRPYTPDQSNPQTQQNLMGRDDGKNSRSGSSQSKRRTKKNQVVP